ncbi:MAG: hypothetical protein RSD46_04005 [Oscillospiraceae bacterium]
MKVTLKPEPDQTPAAEPASKVKPSFDASPKAQPKNPTRTRTPTTKAAV